MTVEITGVNSDLSAPYWSYAYNPDISIQEGDNVVIIVPGITYEVIASVYALYVGPTTDTLSVLGSDNHIYCLTPKAYVEARNQYLELYEGTQTPPKATETAEGDCSHFRTERVVGCMLQEKYEWTRCLECRAEV